MPKHQFDTDNQPHNRAPRGKSFKTMVLDALKKQGMSEQDFINNLVERALADGGIYLSELLKRYSPVHKQTNEPIIIDNWPAGGTSLQKADAVLQSMSEGVIPPDLGALFIESISKTLGIAELTELAQRLESIEKLLEGK